MASLFLGLPLMVAACGRGPEPGVLAGWNVVLITIDTLRADRLGYAGWTGADTPTLDGLAAEGVVFEGAVATAPVTLPSHATLMTGLTPPRHGALDNGLYRLAEGVPTLATRLRSAGYATGAVIGAYVLHRQYGLDAGFDHYDDRFRQPRGAGSAPRERRAAVVTDRALEWVAGRREAAADGSAQGSGAAPDPYFLWVHYYDPHSPYDPPPPYRLRFATRPYDGEIAYTDAQIGRLLDGLRAAGELDRTLVVVTADHGEALGDGGEKTHGLLLRGSTLKVPFLLWAPGALPAGRRVDGTTSGVDLAPTVRDLLGLDAGAAGAAGTAAGTAADSDPSAGEDGRSLVPAIAGGRTEGRPAYSETRLPRDQFGWAILTGARDDRWAWVRAPIPELYDLEEDPGETRIVVDDHPAVVARLDAVVESVLEADGGGEERTVSAEELEALRSLGYVLPDERATAGGADPKERIATWRETEAVREALESGRFEEAVRLSESVAARDPDNPELLLHRGQALVAVGRTEEGLADLHRSFEITGNRDIHGSILARALAQADRPEEAEELLLAFERDHPQVADHPFNRGVLLESQGRVEEAVDAYAIAHRLNPDAVHVLANYASALAGTEAGRRDPERVVSLVDRAVHLAGDDDRPRLLRIRVLAAIGRVAEARAAAEELQRRGMVRGITATELAEALRALPED